ncbi:ribosome biogenesis regulatory -like protein [Brachionus plicatilis]|uniref:Ribosome biogenesis regulatory protein n=1 Tax=Brachionus plicatilis TaxID=10195 RepID=A0A3M7QC05_BRAPC|nr:ribosome biogenesis regulatory -like protein [Brachionus plicatilis]
MVAMENTDSLQQAASVSVQDIGNLVQFDPRPIDSSEFKKDPDSFLKQACTIGTQLLINNIFQLPVEKIDDVIIAKLPAPSTTLPREKPIPKEKPLTKWEQYAKLKGIKNKKKQRKVWDETSKTWKPTWGYKRINDKTKDWLIEIKKNEDPNQDFFSKRTQERNERVSKNELQRLRNIARSSKKKVPGVGATPSVLSENPDKLKLKKALNIAKRADASMSKFSRKLENEDKVTKGLGKKRKFESNYGDIKNEKDKQLKLFEKLTSTKDRSSKEKLNIEKATNKFIQSENAEKSSGKKKLAKRSKMGGKNKKFSKKK